MDINNLMRQAQAMQRQLEETTKRLNAMQFEGSASNGLVKVVVTGEYKVVSVKIDPEIVNKEDTEMIEDMIVIAMNDAVAKVDQSKKDSLGPMASMLGI